MKGRRARWSYAYFVLLAALAAAGATLCPAGGSKRLAHKHEAVYAVIDLADGSYRVSPALAAAKDGSESFEALVSRVKPYAAISGTYHDANYKPLGDVIIGGRVICRGQQRQGIGFTKSGKIRFAERKGRSRIDWRGCYSGIACGPRLLRAGRKDLDVRRDGFSEAALSKSATRCAVGATRDGRLVICAVLKPVTLDTLADIVLELGACDAINLDGGSACAFYLNGKFHARPLTQTSNILAVYRPHQKRAELVEPRP